MLFRSRARRCVEACVYGTLDFVGYHRFPAPVEFIAAVIAYYVHPVNIRSEEHTSELQSPKDLVCRLLLEKKKADMRGPEHVLAAVAVGEAPERFLPLDITSLLLHVIFDARFLLRQ